MGERRRREDSHRSCGRGHIVKDILMDDTIDGNLIKTNKFFCLFRPLRLVIGRPNIAFFGGKFKIWNVLRRGRGATER